MKKLCCVWKRKHISREGHHRSSFPNCPIALIFHNDNKKKKGMTGDIVWSDKLQVTNSGENRMEWKVNARKVQLPFSHDTFDIHNHWMLLLNSHLRSPVILFGNSLFLSLFFSIFPVYHRTLHYINTDCRENGAGVTELLVLRHETQKSTENER